MQERKAERTKGICIEIQEQYEKKKDRKNDMMTERKRNKKQKKTVGKQDMKHERRENNKITKDVSTKKRRTVRERQRIEEKSALPLRQERSGCEFRFSLWFPPLNIPQVTNFPHVAGSQVLASQVSTQKHLKT